MRVIGTLRVPALASDPVDAAVLGQLYFNTGTGTLKVYKASGWSDL